MHMHKYYMYTMYHCKTWITKLLLKTFLSLSLSHTHTHTHTLPHCENSMYHYCFLLQWKTEDIVCVHYLKYHFFLSIYLCSKRTKTLDPDVHLWRTVVKSGQKIGAAEHQNHECTYWPGKTNLLIGGSITYRQPPIS